MKTPVLFLIFSRPDTSAQVLEAIRQAKPSRLYVAADGPRAHKEGEKALCDETRQLVLDAIDWECEVKTLFRDKNLGCKNAIADAIDWFFANEEEGIILEDDVLPAPSFFPFCEEMLERYRNDERIGSIAGCNMAAEFVQPDESYFFSIYNKIWGWATWRRAWALYDRDIKDWPEWHQQKGLQTLNAGLSFESYWHYQFEKMYHQKVDTWDFQWLYTSWKHNLLTVVPSINLVENLGFDERATHTYRGPAPTCLNNENKTLAFPLIHPQQVAARQDIDRILDVKAFTVRQLNLSKRIRFHLLGRWTNSVYVHKKISS
jgi:hypothetical protein